MKLGNWVKSLQINDKIDYYDHHNNQWVVANIIGIDHDNNNVTISYKLFLHSFCIRTQCKQFEYTKHHNVICPVYTHTVKYESLKIKHLIKPMYHYSHQSNKQFIIYPSSDEIHLFCIDEQKWSTIYRPYGIPLGFSKIAITNKEIYFYQIDEHLTCYNLSTNTWKVLNYLNHNYIGNLFENQQKDWKNDNQSVIMKSIGNNIHLFDFSDNSRNKHCIYNTNNNKFIKLNDIDPQHAFLNNNAMIYVPFKQQIMCFGLLDVFRSNIDGKSIYYIDIDPISPPNDHVQPLRYKSHRHNQLTLPDGETNSKFSCILAFDYIVVLFYENVGLVNHCEANIWCLDLLRNKWYKSSKQHPSIGQDGDISVFKTDSNDVYFYSKGKFSVDRYHYKYSLYDVIPTELLQSIDLLTTGYFYHHYFMHRNDLIFPNDIKQIILQYWGHWS